MGFVWVMIVGFVVNEMRNKDEIQEILDAASRLRDTWSDASREEGITRAEFATAIRNYNALRGVIKTLQWVLGNPSIRDPLS